MGRAGMFKVIVLASFTTLVGCTTHTQLGNDSPVSTNVIHFNNESSPVRVIFSLKELSGQQYEIMGAITASGNYRKTNDNMLMESLKRQAAQMGANVLLFEGFSDDLPPSDASGSGWEAVGQQLANTATIIMAKAYAKGYAIKIK